MTEDLVFQQDNCSVNVSRNTVQYLEDHNILLLEWPSRSPDLNIVENVWPSMYHGGRAYRNIVEPELAIRDGYASIKDDFVLQLFASIPNRLIDVAERKGGIIDY
jgi:hypothetical protein